VRAAFAAREPVPRKRARWPIVAVAAGAAVVAAALSPPGIAVLGSIRDAVRGEPNAKPALFSLPTAGRLLVNSDRGAWVVQQDGSKRLLEGYRDAAWSPHGLFLAAVKGHELRALEPDGDVHWSLGRSGTIRFPRWSNEGFRIAYVAGSTLRIVNGDGTGDRVLARGVALVAPAWLPNSARHVLAYVNRRGFVSVVDADTHRVLSRDRTGTEGGPVVTPSEIAWTSTGRYLVAVASREVVVRPAGDRVSAALPLPPGRHALAPAPRSDRFALTRATAKGQTEVIVFGPRARPAQRVFLGRGTFASVTWAPDSKWLLLNWTSADQWVFVRSAAQRVRAVSNITESFGPNPSIAGWCCG
jgi:Tol biopolymer transport system component